MTKKKKKDKICDFNQIKMIFFTIKLITIKIKYNFFFQLFILFIYNLNYFYFYLNFLH